MSSVTFDRPKRQYDLKTAGIDSEGNLLLFAKNKQPIRVPRRHLPSLRWLLDQAPK